MVSTGDAWFGKQMLVFLVQFKFSLLHQCCSLYSRLKWPITVFLYWLMSSFIRVNWADEWHLSNTLWGGKVLEFKWSCRHKGAGLNKLMLFCSERKAMHSLSASCSVKVSFFRQHVAAIYNLLRAGFKCQTEWVSLLSDEWEYTVM